MEGVFSSSLSRVLFMLKLLLFCQWCDFSVHVYADFCCMLRAGFIRLGKHTGLVCCNFVEGLTMLVNTLVCPDVILLGHVLWKIC